MDGVWLDEDRDMEELGGREKGVEENVFFVIRRREMIVCCVEEDTLILSEGSFQYASHRFDDIIVSDRKSFVASYSAEWTE